MVMEYAKQQKWWVCRRCENEGKFMELFSIPRLYGAIYAKPYPGEIKAPMQSQERRAYSTCFKFWYPIKVVNCARMNVSTSVDQDVSIWYSYVKMLNSAKVIDLCMLNKYWSAYSFYQISNHLIFHFKNLVLVSDCWKIGFYLFSKKKSSISTTIWRNPTYSRFLQHIAYL